MAEALAEERGPCDRYMAAVQGWLVLAAKTRLDYEMRALYTNSHGSRFPQRRWDSV
jgi:hypothetical protein